MRISQVVSVLIAATIVWAHVGAAAPGTPADLAENPNGEPSITDHPEVASVIARLETWIESKRASERWPGIVIGIVHDQELIYARGFGYADVEKKIPVNRDTLFQIASNTKLFTAISILMLRDEGKLDLDDPVRLYIEDFARLDEKNRESAPGVPPITIFNLLTHTSGLPRETPGTSWTDVRFPTLAELDSTLSVVEPAFLPHTQWKYSNLGVSLEGQVVAKVSGLGYEEFIETRLIEPLGMSSSGFSTEGQPVSRVATRYGPFDLDKGRAVIPAFDVKSNAPAAGIWSTVSDLARFASWQFRLLDGGATEILNPYTLRDMQRVHWLDPSWGFGWGLGFYVYREHGGLLGHGGRTPGHLTDFTISATDKIGVIAMANADDIHIYTYQPDGVSNRIFQWVVPAIREATKDEPDPPVADPAWDKYVGKYEDWALRIEVAIDGGRLVLFKPSNPVESRFGGWAVLRHTKTEHTFTIETGNGFGVPGEKAVFELNEDGRVIAVRHPGRRFHRVSHW